MGLRCLATHVRQVRRVFKLPQSRRARIYVLPRPGQDWKNTVTGSLPKLDQM